MYISKLDIFGFKSFAKKTSLNFGPGITGIVGPNGCGKTNVVDAIRWVLGEQKTSVLRSDNMQEVIFNGSKSLKPLGMCEVSLTIHNNKGLLPVEYNDVMVTRRLYRDGQSEYLLNKQPCRLKDIQNLFIDTGMSADAYSVIELKMVENILSDTRDERTRMFEEAAGINKYKQERRAAYRKLDATKEDLLRINDILFEIEKNVGSLKRQMRKYERYQRYQSELEEKELQLAGHRLWRIEEELIPLEEQLEQGRDIQSSSAEQIEMDESLQSKLKEKIRAQEKRLNALDSELESMDEDRQQAKRNILVWNEQKNAAEQTVKRLNQEEISLKDRVEQTRLQINTLQEELEEIQPQLDKAEQDYQAQQEQYQQIDATYRELQETLQQQQQEKIDSITELADVRNQRDRMVENRDRIESEIQEHRERLDELKEELRETERELQSTREELGQMDTGSTAHREEKNRLEEHQNDLQEEIEETRERLMKQQSQEDVLRSKIDFYQELIENREGYSSAVQYLTGENKPVEGILGTVAEVIHVEDDYRLAVENALGEQAEYLIARDRAAARKAIEMVTQSKRGRVSIIPLRELRSGTNRSAEMSQNGKRLVEQLQYDSRFTPVIELLLGDVLIGAPSESGGNGEMWRYVSPGGEVQETTGILRGGKAESDYTSRVGRQEVLDRLEESLEENLATQEQTRESLSNSRAALQEIGEQLTELESAAEERANKRQSLQQRLDRLEYETERIRKRRQETDSKIDSLETQRTQLRESLGEIEPVLQNLQEHRQQLQQRVQETEEELEDLSDQRSRENSKLQDLRLERASRQNEKETLEIRLGNARETLEDIEQRFESIAEEREEAQDTIKQRAQALEQEEDRLQELEESYQQLRTRREERQEKLSAKQEELDEVEERIREKHRERESQYDRIRSIEEQIHELQGEKRSVRERIQDRYGTEIEPNRLEEESSEGELEQDIQTLRSRIDRMGPVNLAVKEEFEEEQERLDFLTDQRDDLLEAKEDLLETIDRIDREASEQFNEVFSSIRENFHRTFSMFFPGGEADLQLTSDEDPLDVDIDIQASPAGKKLQSLRMLSAGEKTLTAIALLFAIYLVKPSPFCILDEVDAPLDDNNSQIFREVLNDFVTDTQFIVVTHNKITMESVNYMYGITMEDEGVSRVVSVSFD